MSNLAEQLQAQELYLETATVVQMDGPELVLRAGDRRVTAERAVMCLVEPAVGDRVMLGSSASESFVLGVLSRADDAAKRISVDGDLDLQLPQGRFRVASRDGIDLTTSRDIAITSRRWFLRALDGSVVVDKLRLLSSQLHGDVSKLSLVAGTVESLAERIRVRAKRVYRFVEQFDQLRANHIDHRAKGVARMHGENTVITADEIAKLDGEQIHVG